MEITDVKRFILNTTSISNQVSFALFSDSLMNCTDLMIFITTNMYFDK